MAENLYSQYRPEIFSEVFGHSKIIKELQQRSKENNFPQVMYFHGYTGTGKGTIEKIISKSLLCQNKDSEGNPCCKCDFCLTVRNERLSNYYYMFNASNLGIDEMRAIEELSNRKSLTTAKSKVIVIDELQELSSNQKAMKNILKILEKPLKSTYFVLLSMDNNKVNDAIKNRSVPYRLKDLDEEDIGNYLCHICSKENIEITADKAEVILTIAENCNGSMRTAVSFLERAIYSDIWNTKELLTEIGIVSNEKLTVMINKILLGDFSVFENEITKDIMDRIKYYLNLYYKYKNGVELNTYQLNSLKGFAKVSSEELKRTLEEIHKLSYLPYVTQEMIDFVLIDILNKNKILVEQLSGEPGEKRRRPKIN